MLQDRDIWESATFLVNTHGDGAVGLAMEHAVTLGRAGDLEGVSMWALIAIAAHQVAKAIPDWSPPPQ
jgi:hypothetical protein